MRLIRNCIFFIFLLHLFSCDNGNAIKQNNFGPKVSFTNGVTIKPESVRKLKAIPAGEPVIITAGKPAINPADFNFTPIGQPKIIAVGKPKIIVLGSDSFSIPETFPAKGITKAAGLPEVDIAKDMANKGQNPSNFSFFKVLQGLKHNIVRSILQDRSGNIWFGTYAGFCRYDGKSFTNFSDKEGLASNQVLQAIEDNSGKFWIGTFSGITCYDGKNFTNYTTNEGLNNNIVYSMLKDKRGKIWFGTYGGGVTCYDGKNFTNYGTKEGLVNNSVLSIIEDMQGNIWFGTDGGVSRYDGNRVEAIERGENIPQSDIVKVDGKPVKSFTNYTEKEGLPVNLINYVIEDKKGNIWFGTKGGGAVCYAENKENNSKKQNSVKPLMTKNTNIDEMKKAPANPATFTIYTEKEGLASNNVYTMHEDNLGNIWFATYGGGLSCYNGNRIDAQPKNNEYEIKGFKNFTEKEGLPNNYVLSILEDRSGNIWFGTDGGVCKYDGKLFSNYTTAEGLSDNLIMNIHEDKSGNIWFATYGSGVCCYKDRPQGSENAGFTNFTVKEGLASNLIYSMLEDKKGNLWFASYGGGLSKYDGKTFANFTTKQGLIENAFHCITEDKNGCIWLGTLYGAVCYDGKSFINFTEKEGLSDNKVQVIFEDKAGVLWFGTNGGVTRYDRQKESFTHFTTKEGLAHNSVNAIYEDRYGNIWVGTTGGISCYDIQFLSEGKAGFINFTEKDGLVNNAVQSILGDKEGNLWFGTRKGLSKITGKKLEKINNSPVSELNPMRDALFCNYSYNDGFLGLTCKRGSVLEDSKGRIWWGADELICYSAAGDIADTVAPVVNLTSIKLFNEEIAWAKLGAVSIDSTGKEIVNGNSKDTVLANGVLLKDVQFNGISKWYSLPQNLSLSHSNNNLTFNFIGVHMQSRNHIKYQYQLAGIDPGWSSIIERTEAPYGNLPSGDYTFKVKARNQSGVWSEPFEFSFCVRPPWWQTWWFRFFVAAGLLSSIWYYIKWRERKLKSEKNKLEKTVEERTTEVVNEKKLVEEKNVLIEKKQKEILDSIQYASRIQKALITSEKYIQRKLDELTKKGL